MAARLDTLAREQHRSKSAILRESLRKGLDVQQKSRSVRAYDLVEHLCGVVKGGPDDLATNPEHLRGFGE